MPTLSDRNNEKAQRGLRNRADVAEQVAEVRAADERRRTQPDRTQEAGLRDPAAGRRTGTQPISPSLTQRDVQRAEFRGNTEANRRMSMLTRTTSGRGFTRGQAAAIAGAPSGADFARQTIQNRLAGQTPNQSQVASEELGLRRMESDRGFALGERQDDTTRRGQDINMTGTMQGLRSQERITGDTLEAQERVAGADRESREGIASADRESREGIASDRNDTAIIQTMMQLGASREQAQARSQQASESHRLAMGGSVEAAASLAKVFTPMVNQQLRASGVNLGDDAEAAVGAQLSRLYQRVGENPEEFGNITEAEALNYTILNFALADTEKGGDGFARNTREMIMQASGRAERGATLDAADLLSRVDNIVTSGRASNIFGVGAARGESEGSTFVHGDLRGPAADLFQQLVQQRTQAIMSRPLADETRQKFMSNTQRELQSQVRAVERDISRAQVRAKDRLGGGPGPSRLSPEETQAQREQIRQESEAELAPIFLEMANLYRAPDGASEKDLEVERRELQNILAQDNLPEPAREQILERFHEVADTAHANRRGLRVDQFRDSRARQNPRLGEL